MLVQCIFNKGKDLPLSVRGLGETDETSFSFLNIGEAYLIYGLMFSGASIDYLVCKVGESPYWVTSHLFKILDKRLPWEWSVCLTQFSPEYKPLFEQLNIETLIGYPDLVKSYAHYNGIIEREFDELEKFFKAKMAVDEWWDICR